MGPHFFKCGNIHGGELFFLIISASMGPHFFKCGNLSMMSNQPDNFNRFNGAALFQVRKRHHGVFYHRYHCAASMGPHFFKCGNPNRKVEEDEAEGASMGPHFFKCGNPAEWAKRKVKYWEASMGPHFFKCGNSPRLEED